MQYIAAGGFAVWHCGQMRRAAGGSASSPVGVSAGQTGVVASASASDSTTVRRDAPS
jgi:hypothetical protein